MHTPRATKSRPLGHVRFCHSICIAESDYPRSRALVVGSVGSTRTYSDLKCATPSNEDWVRVRNRPCVQNKTHPNHISLGTVPYEPIVDTPANFVFKLKVSLHNFFTRTESRRSQFKQHRKEKDSIKSQSNIHPKKNCTSLSRQQR